MSVLVKPHGGGDSGGNKGNTNSFDSCLLAVSPSCCWNCKKNTKIFVDTQTKMINYFRLLVPTELSSEPYKIGFDDELQLYWELFNHSQLSRT